MRSELIEFFRFNNQKKGMLRRGDRYLRARGNEPAREVPVPIDHDDFMELLDLLRYGRPISEAQRLRALGKLTGVVTKMLGLGPVTPLDEALQIDLVTNAAELAALPFELAVGADGNPLFAVSDGPVILTRRVRRDSHGQRSAWWTKPRVLFAVASPPGAGPPVPLDEHKDALREALTPWIEPLQGFPEAIRNVDSVLKVVCDASPQAIREAGLAAIKEKKPFTHLHILAHGCTLGTSTWKQRFGLAMHQSRDANKMIKVKPKDLSAALAPIAGDLVVVTVAACDAGNQANSIAGGGSLAHELHTSGIPVVVASQFPLTFDGSVTFTKTFYRCLLAGHDIRDALHQARSDLYRQAGHDWASLVGYVQLPEDYADRLAEVGLQAERAALLTAQQWSDHLVKHDSRDSTTFADVASGLRERIKNLERFQQQHADRMTASTMNENLGLLGSAEKRLAELYFHRAAFGDDTPRWMSDSEEALWRAKDWYQQSFTRSLSHHWTGVQSLALEAVLTGRIERVGRWYAAKEAAEADNEREDEPWASGTLAELCLIAPRAGLDARLDEAGNWLSELVRRVLADGHDFFFIDSTRRQFERYVHWWTKENRYFGASPDLAGEAKQLLSRLSLDRRDLEIMRRRRCAAVGHENWVPRQVTAPSSLKVRHRDQSQVSGMDRSRRNSTTSSPSTERTIR